MPYSAKHISGGFDAALYGLRNDVLMMSSLADRIFQTAFEPLLNRDSELCDHVIAEDDEIDVLEKQVDQEGVSLLLRFHPVASDMRQVVSAMKISTGLERIGDLSVTIARKAKQLNSRPAPITSTITPGPRWDWVILSALLPRHQSPRNDPHDQATTS